MCIIFSPENLQAEAVKGLSVSAYLYICIYTLQPRQRRLTDSFPRLSRFNVGLLLLSLSLLLSSYSFLSNVALCHVTGVDVWRQTGDRAVFTCGSRVPELRAVQFPWRQATHRAPEPGACCTGLDGRLQPLLLRCRGQWVLRSFLNSRAGA